MARRLRIVLADDLLEPKIDAMVGAICDWLAPSASESAARQRVVRDRVEQRVSAIREFVDFCWTTEHEEGMRLLEQPCDVAIIDHRWTRHPKPDSAGLELLDYAHTRHPAASLFQYTAHFETLAPTVTQAFRDHGAAAVPTLDFPRFITDQLAPALQNAAAVRVRQMSAPDRLALRKACLDPGDLQVLLDKIAGDWRVRDLTIGWRTHSAYPSELPEILRNLVKDDLTYAASLYFGVGPIKQITHGLQWYYKAKSPSAILDEARQRLGGL
jgi:hypothetical protein